MKPAVYRAAAAIAALALAPGQALAQAELTTLDGRDWGLRSIGWEGFLDTQFMIESVASLALAAILGAVIAYHPRIRRTVDTVEEAELPKAFVIYAIIGAAVGITVLKYGMVVGFVIFGLGGLMRFRTNTESTRDTGRLIVVTLLGLNAGLGLPHFAVVAAVFVYGMIYLLEQRPLCRLIVREMPETKVGEASEAYRQALKGAGCAIIAEKVSFEKEKVEFTFRCPYNAEQDNLRLTVMQKVPQEMRGEANWEIE